MKPPRISTRPAIYPMPEGHDTRHGACGRTWKQRGNTTGHCADCHETFEGLALFDAHRITKDDGKRGCLDPAAMTYKGEPLRLINDSWRGPAMDEETLARKTGGLAA